MLMVENVLLVEVARITAVPGVRKAVKVTVTTPPTVVAVGAEKVPEPESRVKLITSPSTALPFASLTSARIVLELSPSAFSMEGVAVREITLTGPAIKVTAVLDDAPAAVAVTVAVPTFVELMRNTDAWPSVVSALEEDSVPAVVLNVTDVPSSTSSPSEFLAVTLTQILETPSATISSEPASTVTEPTDGAPPSSPPPPPHDTSNDKAKNIIKETNPIRKFPRYFFPIITAIPIN